MHMILQEQRKQQHRMKEKMSKVIETERNNNIRFIYPFQNNNIQTPPSTKKMYLFLYNAGISILYEMERMKKKSEKKIPTINKKNSKKSTINYKCPENTLNIKYYYRLEF